jgi:hypothetical protein
MMMIITTDFLNLLPAMPLTDVNTLKSALK